ncbi:MAG: DUF3334 family protein [Desulfurivibrionaceae bacterium]
MDGGTKTIDIMAGIFSQATKKILEKSTGMKITYSSTLQKIPKVRLCPDIGCFVQFSGDYAGLVVMNYNSSAAMTIYKNYMTTMGLPESELARESTSNEVVDTIGEITNQIMGRAMYLVESKYQLSSYFGQPKALALNSAITLSPDMDYQDNRRISFAVDTYKFYMEIALEQTEFISSLKK